MLQDDQNELYHHGILGQRWGIRRYQNPDGSLTEAGKAHYDKLDTKWAAKNNNKVLKKAHKAVARDMKKFNKELSKQPGYLNANGQISKKAINAYNRHMADLMNERITDIHSPSGKVVKFVALRGDVGVQLALATPGYDMSKISKGVWGDGRVAYRKNQLDKIDI